MNFKKNYIKNETGSNDIYLKLMLNNNITIENAIDCETMDKF